jgi:hypothetical protein
MGTANAIAHDGLLGQQSSFDFGISGEGWELGSDDSIVGTPTGENR